jgi:hypothetical protein
VTIREFTDSKGITWRVWATFPVHVTATAAGYRDGWLTFQSGATRRRIAPVPLNWQDASASRLELVCANAELVSERASRGPALRDRLEEPRD